MGKVDRSAAPQDSPRLYRRTVLRMGTVVSVEVVSTGPAAEAEAAIDRALAWFRRVEHACSRFDGDSELRRLCRQVEVAIEVSPLLFEPLRFALAVAERTCGVFDPTVGRILYARGFDLHYLTGERVADQPAEPGCASYRDIMVDPGRRTVLLRKPMTLDLGAVAKGFAVDLAARELQSFSGFVIDAGGDVYAGGRNAEGEMWRIGVRHPVVPHGLVCVLRASGMAVCTSGGYERKSPVHPGEHHLVHPKTGRSPTKVVSVTVLAPHAMLADALSTAVFLMGWEAGQDLLKDCEAEALCMDDTLNVLMTEGMKAYLHGR
ncbi:MAG: FAD:protein FMN transferase [Alicyclobacillaceae bacterium]|nr:FAD:protein FMN transferase [Alicyclobacillaceae bacterium]